MKDDVIKYESKLDYPSRFNGQSWDKDPGFGLHFHRNIEIYGVTHGSVLASVAGEKKLLTDGQIAVSDCMEGHSFTVTDGGTAETWYFHLGTNYLGTFRSVYKNSKLPRFLLDSDYNTNVIYERIKTFLNRTDMPQELRCYGISCELIADIVERYGVESKVMNENDQSLLEEIIQYIFDHSNEDLTLENLSKIFYLTPKQLSKKLHESLGIDLREFINNIRVQKVDRMLSDPANKGLSIKEIASLCGFKYIETYYKVRKRNQNHQNIY